MTSHLTVMLFICVARDPQIGNIYLLSLLIDRLSEGQFVLTCFVLKSKTFRQFEKYLIFGTISSTCLFFVLLTTY
jgi:hypothetical protein